MAGYSNGAKLTIPDAQQDQVNRPAATDVRQVEGSYRRVRLNA